MKEYKEINGKRFEVVRKPSTELMRLIHRHVGGVTLDNVYGSYSDKKAEVYNDYKSWSDKCGRLVEHLSVASHNRYVFTMSALYCDPELMDGFRTWVDGVGWVCGYIRILPTHDYLYIEED